MQLSTAVHIKHVARSYISSIVALSLLRRRNLQQVPEYSRRKKHHGNVTARFLAVTVLAFATSRQLDYGESQQLEPLSTTTGGGIKHCIS